MKKYHHPIFRYLILLFALLTLAPLNTCAEQATSTPDDPIALLKQGMAYCCGDGVEEDETKGKELIRSAIDKGVKKPAAQGNAEAQFSLGLCYLRGYGVDEDEAEAIKWYRKAAEQGHARARRMLGQCCYELGKCYRDGIGVEKDEEQAKQWIRKAADESYDAAKELLREPEQK